MGFINQQTLVGGLEHFSHILGIINPTDFHIFQRGWNHQPDLNVGRSQKSDVKKLVLRLDSQVSSTVAKMTAVTMDTATAANVFVARHGVWWFWSVQHGSNGKEVFLARSHDAKADGFNRDGPQWSITKIPTENFPNLRTKWIDPILSQLFVWLSFGGSHLGKGFLMVMSNCIPKIDDFHPKLEAVLG